MDDRIWNQFLAPGLLGDLGEEVGHLADESEFERSLVSSIVFEEARVQKLIFNLGLSICRCRIPQGPRLPTELKLKRREL